MGPLYTKRRLFNMAAFVNFRPPPPLLLCCSVVFSRSAPLVVDSVGFSHSPPAPPVGFSVGFSPFPWALFNGRVSWFRLAESITPSRLLSYIVPPSRRVHHSLSSVVIYRSAVFPLLKRTLPAPHPLSNHVSYLI